MLRQVQSDRSNLAHGWLPFAADSIRQQFGTQMPQGGHPPHHSITSSARASNFAGISNKLRAHFLRSGGMFGTIGKFATSSGLSRNAAGYLSGLVFSSGSVERQAYRQVLQR